MSRNKNWSLTKLESEVMRVVWDAGDEPICVRDVLEALNRQRRKKLAYNTVQTVLTILKQKGVVKTVKGPGRAHYFVARLSRRDASHQMVSDLAHRLFGGPIQPLLHQIIDDADLSQSDLGELKRWVESKLRDREEGEK